MRFMMIVRANQDSEAGKMPSRELMEAMGRFNEEMLSAGVLLAGEGLHPSSQGARVQFSGGKKSVIDGPFAETKELIAGYWMMQVKSKDEAVEWALRCPAPFGEDQFGELELRRVFDASDFPADVLTPEAAAREQEMREELDRRAKG